MSGELGWLGWLGRFEIVSTPFFFLRAQHGR